MTKKDALFIGGVRFDITAVPPPGFALGGDTKVAAVDGGYEWGGSAARAVQCANEVGGLNVTFMTKGSNDPLGTSFRADMRKRGVRLYEYILKRFPCAVVLPNMGKRDALLLESPDDNEANWKDFRHLNVSDYAGIYSDGKLPHAAIHHFKMANAKEIPTLLDACVGRHHTDDLIRNSRYVIASSYLGGDRGLSQLQMLELLRHLGAEVGAVTLGEYGLIWYEPGVTLRYMPGLIVPKVENANGAGDVLHEEVFRDRLLNPGNSWQQHFERGRAAASHLIQSTHDRLPTDKNIEKAMQLPKSTARPEWLPAELR